MNEFDVKFSQKLYRRKTTDQCSCFKCTVGGENEKKLSKTSETIRNIKIVGIWLGSILLFLIVGLLLTGYLEYELTQLYAVYSSLVAGILNNKESNVKNFELYNPVRVIFGNGELTVAVGDVDVYSETATDNKVTLKPNSITTQYDK